MRFLSSLLLASLSLFSPACVSASAAGSSSPGIITLQMNRRHMSPQSLEDSIHGAQHVMDNGKSRKFNSMATKFAGCPQLLFSVDTTIAGSKYKLIVDTGSSTLAIVGSACATCPQNLNPKYTPTQLVQGAPIAQARYGDGSGWSGRVVQDTLTVDGTSPVPVRFVSIDSQTNGFFIRGECSNFNSNNYLDHGIMGFAYQSLAAQGANVFFNQLVATTQIRNQFSTLTCYTTGTITMGGVTPGEYSGLFYYTPIIQRAWYVVQVTNMLLGGRTLGLSAATFANTANNGAPANAIVDSGTTLMIVPPAAYNAILTSLNNNAAFNTAFGQGAAAQLAQGQCLLLANRLTGQAAINYVNQNLPALNIVMAGGFTLNLGAGTSYLLPYDATTPAFCLGIANGGATTTILGWPFVNQFVIVHDIANSRIGFATQVGCANGAGGTITAGTNRGEAAPTGTTNPTQTPDTTQAPQTTVAPTAKPPATTQPPATRAPTPVPNKPPTVPPPSTTVNCPRGRFGPNCTMVYDVIQCVVGLPFQVILTPGRSGTTFSQAFARDMAAAAGTTANNVMVLQVVDRGDQASTIIQFALIASSRNALIASLNLLARNFLQARAKLVQAALLGTLSADQGFIILDNAGSGVESLNEDGVVMPNDSSAAVPMAAIIGAVVGGVVLIMVVAGVIVYRRRSTKSKSTSYETSKPAIPMTTTSRVQASSTGFTTTNPVQPPNNSVVAW